MHEFRIYYKHKNLLLSLIFTKFTNKAKNTRHARRVQYFAPNIHDIFWKAAKLCSYCKVEVSLEHATELMEAIEQIHHLFWGTKNRDVAWYTAS